MYRIITSISSFFWSGPILVLLLGTHILLTFRLRFVQKKVFKGIKYSMSGEGSFSILAATLAATLGTGNIIGISTAIALGGPGALLWCWLTGILGMATTYYECYLGCRYRTSEGGGPMYILRDVLKKPKIAAIYAFFMLAVCLGTGCLTQSNAVSDSFNSTFGIAPVPTGFVVALLAGLVIIGGKTSIIKVCTAVVPIMCAIFLLCCTFLLIKNSSYLVESLRLIINTAFMPESITGGIAGGGIAAAARYGIARGLFTNEAGLGSAAVFAGSSNMDSHKQALISMTATFWDTVVICLITGLVIISGYLAIPESYVGYSIGGYLSAAFTSIPYIGAPLLAFSIAGFALSTIIGWFFLGEQAVRFLFPKNNTTILNIIKTIYIVMVFMGSVFSLKSIWEMADFFNILLILPNVYTLLYFQFKTANPPNLSS